VLCYVTDRHQLPQGTGEDAREILLRKITAAAAAEVDWIQLREKDLSGEDYASLTREALDQVAKSPIKRAHRTRILVNDRLDVALAERAGGVHLGESSLPVAEARRLADARDRGADFLIGVSCHSLAGAKTAESGGADYIFFGPVFATPSKAAYGAPQGLAHLAVVCRSVSRPVLAIGGITLENAGSCFSAGASGIAAIRLFQEAPDVGALEKALRLEKV
jgi:thiamine-phosphate pyrophosphorylase